MADEELFDLDEVSPGVWKLRQSPTSYDPQDAVHENRLKNIRVGRAMVIGGNGIPVRTNVVFWMMPFFDSPTAFIRASDLGRIGVFV